MHTHILGIAGTFMGGIAVLASELQQTVTGSDKAVYPPMSTQLHTRGIQYVEGYDAEQLDPAPDCVVVGNVLRRGFPVIETLLNRGWPLVSGPEWIAKQVLANRFVLAISGTHGKTTTASLLAWILDYAGLHPGFLIGGVPNNFGVSARLGTGPHFVIEADEYDTAFFDKRSKFIHYRPRVLVINNIEFDHADIFSNLEAIQQQFHYLVRTVPSEGLIVYNGMDDNVQAVLDKGCWTPTEAFMNEISSGEAGSGAYGNEHLWGRHHHMNAAAALQAACFVGVSRTTAIEAIKTFHGVKRRMELKGQVNGITVYEDFAHHPTAIATTLAGLREKVGQAARIIAVIELRSNTMRLGHHADRLPGACVSADRLYFYASDVRWEMEMPWKAAGKPGGVFSEIPAVLETLLKEIQSGDQLVFMSNGEFGDLPARFLAKQEDGRR